ncbi:LytR C-terminal domain-containing protein [Corynebacterium sp. LaCa116]|uniref:LytR C-terminal domain-containing protein n=1 Tax=Corynebacterium sp. LaCa116 TaxID=3391423 RepID=UPI003989DB60
MTNVNPDNSDSTTPRGPRHAAKPAEPEAATATAAGAASGAKGGAATPANSANSAAPASSGSSAGAGKLPLRGVAMVLIAVAVMLGMWALYSLTSDKDDSAAGDGSGTGDATVSAPATGGAEGGEPGSAAEHGSQDQAGDKPGRDGAAGEAQDGSQPGAPADSTGDSAADAENGAAGQGGNAAGNRKQADIPVNVYNNSARVNYAADEAERLKSENFKVSEVGNLSGDVFTAPQTTIYFPEGDAAAENLAKEVAAQYYGGSVPAEALAPYPAELKGDYTKGDAVVVVLAVPQA